MRYMQKLTMLLLAMLLLACAAQADDEHPFGPWKIKTTATCTRQGHEFRYCRNCDHWEQRYTPKLPHTIDTWTVTKEPTCTEKGSREAVCSVCNNTVRVRIEALGHDWQVTAVTKQPTCDAAGYGTLTCARCGKSKESKIPHLEHAYGAWNVETEPKNGKAGTRTHTCTLCGKTVSEHFYAEGTLYENMTPNADVITMQQMLKDLKYYGGSISSGKFGSVTANAVSAFQKKHNLPATGVADAATLDTLSTAWEKQTGKAAPSFGTAVTAVQ